MQKKASLYLSLTIATIFFIGGVLISFGFWKVDFFQENLSEAGTSCFRLNFEEKNDSISLLDQEPMYDEDGKKLTPYTFTITNTCDDYASYQVNLENLELEEKALPLQYVKVELDQNTPNILTNHTSVDPSLENAHSALS